MRERTRESCRAMSDLYDIEPGAEVPGELVPYGMRVPPEKPPRKKRNARLGRLLNAALAVALMGLAIFALYRLLANVDGADVLAALAAVPIWAMLASVILVALSYGALTGYDFLALHHLDLDVPYRRVALGSFLSYAFANNLGMALLIGGAVRYRIYGRDGVTMADVAIVTAVCGLTFALSALLVVGFCFLFAPDVLEAVVHLPAFINVVLGAAIVGGLLVYVVWVGTAGRSIKWGVWQIGLPGARSTIGQFLVGIADLACGAGALYVLMPETIGVGYPVFVGIFAAAIALGIISHVPGGVGVFETVFLVAVPGVAPERLIACLLLYRCLYYLLPFLVALGLFAWSEASRMRRLGRHWRWANAYGARLLERSRPWARRARILARRSTASLRAFVTAIAGRLPRGSTEL